MYPKNNPVGPNPSGLCECGCGQPAPLAPQSNTKTGVVRGQPTRFIKGHYRMGRPASGPLYTVDDCGHETPCWVWQRKITHGYGYIVRGGKMYRAARYFYEQYIGPIPDGFTIDHLCRNRACVNPGHLEAVTLTENIRRRPATKLSEGVADEIRSLSEQLTQTEIADKFGVHQSSISRILNGDTWR